MEDKLILSQEYDMGDMGLLALTVYYGDECATFKLLGKRGALKAMITIPRYVLADAIDGIARWIELDEIAARSDKSADARPASAG